MAFKALSQPQEAVRVIMRAIGVNSRCSPADARYEAMRSIIWAAAAPSGRVHTNRILNELLPTWELLTPPIVDGIERLRAEMLESLAMLRDVGDVVEQGGGYWGCATSRVVKVRERNGYLIIGAVPTAHLQSVSEAIVYHGPHRHLSDIPKELLGVLPMEELSAWARLPELTLTEWAKDLLQSLERKPYSPAAGESFEFYVPASAQRAAPQFKRWGAVTGKVSGLLLARRARIYGAREYRLVDVRAGKIVSARELHDVDVRRLMYSMDLAAGNPVRAHRSLDQQQVEYRLISELPRAEQRIFAALGRLNIPPDRPYERRWTFPHNTELATELIGKLGIEVIKNSGEPRL